MRLYTLFLALLLPIASYSYSIREEVSAKIEHHEAPTRLEVDAVFALAFNKTTSLEKIIEQFSDYQIIVNPFKSYVSQEIPTPLKSKYCTSNVSPYLLSEILSHLSIYDYCLKLGVERALIVNTSAKIAKDPHELNIPLQKLQKIDPDWDILYTDVDFHDTRNGTIITPQVYDKKGYLQSNKRRVNAHLSKVLARWGAISFVISNSGMNKILNNIDNNWKDLPYDQILF